jgi:Flp pilus assembly secretin CpaC
VRHTIAIEQALGIALTVVLVCGAVAFAQAPQSPGAAAPAAAPKPVVPLKVQVTIARFDGEKKIGNLPFTIWVNANDKSQTTLNFGLRVPTPTTTSQPGDGRTTTTPVTSISYNPVGTNITCGATTLDDGRYRLQLTIDDSSLVPGKDPGATTLPTFQSFTTQTVLLLRDGQAAQFVAATDKISGEVTKIDVSISVLK